MPSFWVSIGLVVTTFYLLFLLYLSHYGSKLTMADVSDYFVADGSLSTLIVFLTGIGTALSSLTFLGSGGLTYSIGIAGIVILGGIVVTDFPAIVIVGEKFWKMSQKDEKDYVTPSDLLCDRFDDSSTIRVIVAAVAVFTSFFYISVQFKGMGLVLNLLSEGFVSTNMGIAYVGLFMGVYIAIGGMRGVAYTDALQAILLFGGMAVIAAYVVMTVPGNIYIQAAQQAEKVATLTSNPINLYTTAAGFGLSIPVWPHMWERYYAARRKSGVWGLGFAEGIGDTFLLTLFAGLIGLAGILIFPGLEGSSADTVILRFIQDMPGPFLGVMMAAAVAAAMSTADSIILMLGSIISRDIYQVLIQGDMPEQQLSKYSKITSGLIAFAALLFATRPLGEFFTFLLDLTFPGYFILLPVAIATFWWARANKYGVIAGLIAGLGTLSYLIWTGQTPLEVWIGFWGGLSMTIALIVVSLATPSPPEDRVQEFVYEMQETSPDLSSQVDPADD
ncbi:sodium:solute symporter family protein [Halobellus limi]|uniref:Sodium:solute symporter family protein n=1 Tax=Halobellus limi TaxID=699433 RepID=A0A1H6CQS8_9EURY|nr:sodium:solute symporter family protein [Halobellus limi]QCC49076.1 sodium:solute symporter family protein [Halobellus limi]SEG75379.1 Sodium:solute symporter family protein [Halobellus limi]